MGNICKRKRLYHVPPKATSEPSLDVIDSLRSISNTSLESVITVQSSASSHSLRFDWEQMQALYVEYKTQFSVRDEILTLPIIDSMKKLLNIIETDPVSASRKLFDSFIEIDKKYPSNFEEYAQKSPVMPMVSNWNERIRLHFISMIFLHRRIVENYLKNTEDIVHMLYLIAISHCLMKVTTSDFRVMDAALGRFLIKNDLINHENAQAIAVYINTITDIISEYMEFSNQSASLTEKSIEHDDRCNKARDNYRHMKEWSSLVEDLRIEVSHTVNTNTYNADKVSQKGSGSTILTAELKEQDEIVQFFAKLSCKRNPNQ